MTPHIESKLEDIAKTVLMPGDPLRAKYIADNFLTDAKLINTVRNMFGYTGKYKGHEITVFASGMGMPSIGIYAYELYKIYGVENIIRLGSCGAYTTNLKIFDTVLVNQSYTTGNFAQNLNNTDCHIANSTAQLNDLIKNTASECDITIKEANVFCSEVFDYYIDDLDVFLATLPSDMNISCAEMESFALFYLAKYLNKNAACLLTVVDNHISHEEISSDKREQSLNDMITLGLEAAIKL